MKDLRLGDDVKKLVDAGVASLKIEGRMKSPLYVASVTKYYRQILDKCEGRSAKGEVRRAISVSDLETVFSRRTTELYLDGRPSESVIDTESLGHLGTPVGVVKKVTRDREGRAWLRFHTCRGLEKHDGLQFEAMTDEGRHLGMGIVEMRQAISRRPVFEVNAGVDVEVLLNEEVEQALKPGMRIYCSMSNAVKRMFPTPSFRPSDYEGGRVVDVEVTLEKEGVSVLTRQECRVSSAGGDQRRRDILVACKNESIRLEPAKDPSRTAEGVRKAFTKLGGTGYRLGKLTVNDPDGLFVPMSVLNDLRRDLVEALDAWREKALHAKIEAAKEESVESAAAWGHAALPHEDVADGATSRSASGVDVADGATSRSASGVGRDDPIAPLIPSGVGRDDPIAPRRRIKIRADQSLPTGEWDEVVVAINAETAVNILSTFNLQPSTCRLATPVYTSELTFNKLRAAVKRFLRAGYGKWEASDLATLRMLKELGVTDITADWTLYAFNARALAQVAALGVKRFVASPENGRENLQYLAESGYEVEFLSQQSTPLFVSLTKPEANDCGAMGSSRPTPDGRGGAERGPRPTPDGLGGAERDPRPTPDGRGGAMEIGKDLAVFVRDGLWVTTKAVPRTFDIPEGVSTRLDLSWDPA